EPVLFIPGGPGDSGLAGAASTMVNGGGLALLNDGHDVVLFDPRGTGDSVPSFFCPEGLTTTPAGDIQPLGKSSDFLKDSLARCYVRLVNAGVDFGALTLDSLAADVIDVMTALEYKSWDLIAVSFGAEVALASYAKEPSHVKSLVLDSPVVDAA